jgi:hypothetical protein
MFERDVLDPGGIDLIAAAVDHVLDAIDDPQIALLVHDAEIAGLTRMRQLSRRRRIRCNLNGNCSSTAPISEGPSPRS